ncbi:MAG: nickel pincer cofactor biosynthesis protein LarC, partial [Haloarculaceae archaeon]
HDHDWEHGHAHDHDDAGTHAEGSGPHRSYAAVIEVVEGMDLPASVERDAVAVFEVLGEAEAAVHGVDLAEMHFHEVGADDAIADVVGTCLLLADLGVERVTTTPLSAGGGEVAMSHGTYPVPAPAVVEIAERADWELRGGPVDAELLTPTGAALLAHFAEGVDRLPASNVAATGYGAGGHTFPERPNVLRAVLGDGGGGLVRDDVTVLETNLDDATPEVLGDLQRSLADAGARDVSVIPATMKKARPGHLVKVVCKPADAERVARRLAEETGTLGVREHGAGHRWIARRESVTATVLVDGERYPVGVKVASDDAGEVFDVSAEYDDAATAAEATGLAVRDLQRRAEGAVRGGRADRLVHVLEAERWAEVDEEYAPASLETEGFVHCATPAQVPAVAQYNYADAKDPRLLVIDPARVEAEIRYEEQPDGGGYAHVYGPLNADAVLDVLAFPREDGRYVLPEELQA